MKSLLSIVTLTMLAGCAHSRTTSDARMEGLASSPAPSPATDQPSFASPDEGAMALYKAAAAKDLKAMARIVGLPDQEVCSGDAAKDAAQAARFANACDQRHKIVMDGESKARLFIGENNYPVASLLVRRGSAWTFDSAGGREALTARVIGENELATIGVCRAFVQAQYEYYAEDRNADDVLEYAQHLASDNGQHDGLYWLTQGDEPESPLGALVAQARTTGYLAGDAHKLDEARPYHGYVFRILTGQGESAPGGKYSYVINGHMVAGFALIASPAKWNHSGVMTFIVGANGRVYQKNLGEQTRQAAGEITEYNPDDTWTLVQD